jgi:hypothetical protein
MTAMHVKIKTVKMSLYAMKPLGGRGGIALNHS